jgi:hypothetical protein
MRTSSCIATLALRMRVSMSAIGSVIVIVRPLTNSPSSRRDLAGVDQLAQADAAQPNLRYTERGRPQRGTACRPRTLNLGLRCCF